MFLNWISDCIAKTSFPKSNTLEPHGKYCCTWNQTEYADWKDSGYNWVEKEIYKDCNKDKTCSDNPQAPTKYKKKHYNFECPYIECPSPEEKVQNFRYRKRLS